MTCQQNTCLPFPLPENEEMTRARHEDPGHNVLEHSTAVGSCTTMIYIPRQHRTAADKQRVQARGVMKTPGHAPTPCFCRPC